MNKIMPSIFAMVAMATVLVSCSQEEIPAPEPIITITAQPAAPAPLSERSRRANIVLTVEASVTGASTLSYQWYSAPAADNSYGIRIAGATAASYTLPVALTAGTYYFFCEVGAPWISPQWAGAKVTKFVRTNAIPVTVTSTSMVGESVDSLIAD
jgi:hypothetical protein